ncbi:hypothetical protein QBC35DRAFT_98107 [Podospora australis]|uniref:Nephrocystin 3-like N-terminal domain-containing protein n=1 Tax=Podospora australis TaxID=1536484 RepID=A0AAN6WNL7_9PEZI|nr:hypothetical protein QBC35DRAFT_98107 [Podospora australis]
MADPLSTGAGVVGIVSLGIQVCHGLLQYYASWKDSSRNIKCMVSSLESLSLTLKQLGLMLSDTSLPQPAAQNAAFNVQSCKVALGELEEELERVKRYTPPHGDSKLDLLEKLHRHSRGLLYPFKEGTIRNLQDSLDHTIDNLSLATQALQISTTPLYLSKLDLLADRFSDVKLGIETLVRYREDEHTEAIIRWFSRLRPRVKHKEITQQYHPNTCSTFFQSQEFLDWLDQKSSTLWCFGNPGSGKTVLTSAIVDVLEKRLRAPTIGIAFAYCAYADRKVQTFEELVGSLVQQLIRRTGVFPKSARTLHDDHHMEGGPDRPGVIQVLGDVLSQLDRTFVIIDALDECDTEVKVARTLVTELGRFHGSLTCLFTSRDIPLIRSLMSHARYIEIQADEADIRSFLDANIQDDEHLIRLCAQAPDLRSEILDRITANAGGMFLLARLHFQSVASKLNLRKVRKALDTLPGSLERTYDNALDRIKHGQDTDRFELAMRLLAWLALAFEPLSVETIQHALAATELVLDDAEIDLEDLYSEDVLLNICAGIVVFESTGYKKRRLARFVHHSAEEYFERHRHRLFPNGDGHITRSCLAYITLSFTTVTGCTSATVIEQTSSCYCLLPYAARFWFRHGERDSVHHALTGIQKFMESPGIAEWLFEMWEEAMWPQPPFLRGDIEERPPLLLACMTGLAQTAHLLLKAGADPESTSVAASMTSLHYAARNGHLEVTKLLVSFHADIHAWDFKMRTPLHHAIESGHCDVANYLVQRGADVDLPDGVGKTPLAVAARAGNIHTVRLLLEAGADVTIKDASGWTFLHWAIWEESEERQTLAVIQELLDAGAKVDEPDSLGKTPLHHAVNAGLRPVVERLIASGANVNAATDLNKRTVLHYAVLGRDPDPDLFQYLLDAGADARAVDVYEETAVERVVIKRAHLTRLKTWNGILQGLGADVSSWNSTSTAAKHVTAPQLHRPGMPTTKTRIWDVI